MRMNTNVDNTKTYVTDKTVQKELGQVWTPSTITNKMMDKISEDIWKDPTKTFLDPTMGSGNIILDIMKRRIETYNLNPIDVLSTTYGIEIELNTLNFAKQRIKEYIVNKLEKTNDDSLSKVDKLINNNFVNSDIFKWDIEKWCPM